MVVLGIDPGIGTTGYGVVGEDERGDVRLVTYGAIETTPGEPMPERLRALHTAVCALLAEHRRNQWQWNSSSSAGT